MSRRRKINAAAEDETVAAADETEAGDPGAETSKILLALRGSLRIDRDDLDTCLINQPDLYYHVSVEYTRAVAARDEVKLELEELHAVLDKEVRSAAAKLDEKITEARVQNEILLKPRYRELRQLLLERTEEVGQWSALKEGFHQRSYMLRELVGLCIAEGYDNAGASGTYEARARRPGVAEQNREAAGRVRRGRMNAGGAASRG